MAHSTLLRSCQAGELNLLTLILDRLSSKQVDQYFVHMVLPLTDKRLS